MCTACLSSLRDPTPCHALQADAQAYKEEETRKKQDRVRRAQEEQLLITQQIERSTQRRLQVGVRSQHRALGGKALYNDFVESMSHTLILCGTRTKAYLLLLHNGCTPASHMMP